MYFTKTHRHFLIFRYFSVLFFLLIFSVWLSSSSAWAQKKNGKDSKKKIYQKVSKRTPTPTNYRERKNKVLSQKRNRQPRNLSRADYIKKRKLRYNYEPRNRGSISLKVNHNKNKGPRNRPGRMVQRFDNQKKTAGFSGNLKPYHLYRKKFINDYRRKTVHYAGSQIDNRKKIAKFKGNYLWTVERARKRYMTAGRNIEAGFVKKRKQLNFKNISRFKGGPANDFSKKQAYNTGKKKEKKKKKLRYDPNESSIWESPNTYEPPK